MRIVEVGDLISVSQRVRISQHLYKSHFLFIAIHYINTKRTHGSLFFIVYKTKNPSECLYNDKYSVYAC